MGQNQVAIVEIVWEGKKTKRETIRQQCYGRSSTNLYLANAKRVSPWSRELQRVWFGVGGKEPISGILQDLFWGVLCWESIFCSKYVVNQLRPLDACQKDWQKETQGVTLQMRERGTRQNQMDKNLSWDRQWKREKTLGMPKCSGGRTHTVRRVVGISEGCLQQAKIISEQQGQKREITLA